MELLNDMMITSKFICAYFKWNLISIDQLCSALKGVQQASDLWSRAEQRLLPPLTLCLVLPELFEPVWYLLGGSGISMRVIAWQSKEKKVRVFRTWLLVVLGRANILCVLQNILAFCCAGTIREQPADVTRSYTADTTFCKGSCTAHRFWIPQPLANRCTMVRWACFD